MPFIERLSKALRAPLPGRSAQDLMAPPQRQTDPGPADQPRQSAVLALLCASTQERLPATARTPVHWRIVFTERQNSLRHHGGQISFPGGGCDAGDASLLHTALRETQEELGIPIEDIAILGKLTPLFIAPSQNLVHPYVGWLSELPPISPNPAEVAAVLTLPLSVLLAPEAQGTYQWQRDGEALTAPCYCVRDVVIWGATAMMLSELLAIIQGVLR
jgi:8-oxo-dGTP pyrophosphatase MutT (NUDIX family)